MAPLAARPELAPPPDKRIEDAIRTFWKQLEEGIQKLGDPLQRLTKNPGSVFSLLPLISSQQAVEAVLVLEPIVGHKIPESVVKRGGYQSVDEMVKHLLMKLHELDSPQ